MSNYPPGVTPTVKDTRGDGKKERGVFGYLLTYCKGTGVTRGFSRRSIKTIN